MKLHRPNTKQWRRVIMVLLIAVTVVYNLCFSESRLYWPLMLSSYFIGVFIYLGELKRNPSKSAPSLLGYLFPEEAWFNASTFYDCVIGLLNFLLLAAVSRLAFLEFKTVQNWTSSALDHLPFHYEGTTSEPSTLAILFFVALALVLSELFFYFSHRWQHTVPALWEFHKIHHSAEVMTPLTLYRMHPVVLLLPSVCRYLGVGLALGIFTYLYRDAKTAAIDAGTIMSVVMLNFVGGNLQHSHIWMRFPRFLEHILVSPAMHQVHHSIDKKHLNKNYGTLFSFWDWVFGSLYVPIKKEKIVFGLGDAKQMAPYQSLNGLYLSPFKRIAKRMMRTKQARSTA